MMTRDFQLVFHFFSPSLPLNSPVTAKKTKSGFRHPRVFLSNTPSGAKWKFLGVNINHEGHSCGTVLDNNVDFLPKFYLFHQCLSPLIAPPMLLPKVIVCDKIFTFLSKVCCFFLKWVLFFLFLSAEMKSQVSISIQIFD